MWARHAWRREQSRRANGCGQNIFLRRRQSRPQAGVDGEPAAGGGKCKVGPPKEAAVGIGTCTTRAPLDEPKRGQLGPTILLDRPRPAPHSPPPSDFLVGTPRVETRAEPTCEWVRAEHFPSSPSIAPAGRRGR